MLDEHSAAEHKADVEAYKKKAPASAH
jgi:hypothetical protein